MGDDVYCMYIKFSYSPTAALGIIISRVGHDQNISQHEESNNAIKVNSTTVNENLLKK